MKELYIFVDSERPDQYVNSLVHCVLDREVRRVIFLHIKKLTTSEQSRENTGLSARVLASVSSLVEGLADRKEYTFIGGEKNGERISLNEKYGNERSSEISQFYQRLRGLSVQYSNEEVDYDNLRDILANIAKKKVDVYVDITAIKKRYMGDIVAAGLIEGIKGLWTFDLQIKPDFTNPWKMLIHDLLGQDPCLFTYTNILDTPTYKSCVRLVMVRAPRMKWAILGTGAFIILGTIGYVYLGENSSVVKVILAASGLTGISSLILGFWSPRT